MKKLILLLGALACATPGGRTKTESFSGETSEYDVEVFEYYSNGFCMTREITLKEKNGLHISRHHVGHVKAIDRDCDDTFDSFYFRDRRDENVDKSRLSEDLLNIYYILRMNR